MYPQAAAPSYSQLHGKYYTQARAGQMFVASQTPAQANIFAAYPNVQFFYGIWNPLGSGVNAIVVNLRCGIASTSPGVLNAVWVFYNTGSQSNAAPFVSIPFGFSAPQNMLIGQMGGSRVLYSPSTINLTFGATPNAVTGISFVNSSSANYTTVLGEDYDGNFVIGPGTLAVLAASANSPTVMVSTKWYEAPVIG